MSIEVYAEELKQRICGTEASDRDGRPVILDKAIEEIITDLSRLFSEGRKVMFVGNGGSAAIASHMAVDFWKNGKIKATSFNDPSQLTCISNDEGYENVFSFPVLAFAEQGDMLVAISSSGSSPNILNAADAARKKLCRIITLSAFAEDNPLRSKGDINLFVRDMSYGTVETAHAMLCHYVLDRIIERRGNV